eukprot:TRINITY_DN1446_c4_g1_i1.p1 TRINITY_DN1446_c4_g1~~TRINITY_DN1446_c4_g1_i1.p1  ORF type:complete len:428 (+),score=89.92 TRINITY_DN1446_c4_g1_i1:52-1335(+)
MTSVREIARLVRNSSKTVAGLSLSQRNEALRHVADGLSKNKNGISEANKADIERSSTDHEVSKAMLSRLMFQDKKIDQAVAGVTDLIRLDDPIGASQIHRELSPGLELRRVSVPLGVLGIIFEARPDAAVQIAALSIKSGNGTILKCGKEAVLTCTEIVQTIKQSLGSSDCPSESIALLTTREQTGEMMKCNKDIDLIIPRGSNEFVQFVQKNTTIPVLGHADGICHVYVDREADLSKALSIAIDSKTQYPSACNSMETLIVHSDIAATFLPQFEAQCQASNVKINGCPATRQIIASAGEVDSFATEFCDLECNVVIVNDVKDAVSHIDMFGSKHTDCIVSENTTTAQYFQSQVASAGVFHNCSTRFADGFRYGFGAEVGVSTSSLPPRGPVGLDGITTYKYVISGNGHIVSDFASGKSSFTHKDIL